MKKSNINNEYISKFENLSQKIVEDKLLNHFIFLKDENKLNEFYSELDIDKDDQTIISMWEEIIKIK